MTFFQDCSCESARAGMYELDNKRSIKNHRKRKQNQEEWWLKVKRPQQAFFLTLMGYERKTSLSIVRVVGRGCSSSRGCCCTFSCHIGLICDFFGYFSAAAKLQFPYEIKCSTYLFPYLPFSSPSSSKAFEFNIRFLQNFYVGYFVYLFLLISFFIRRLFYSCQLLTWLFLCFFFLLAFVLLLYCVRVKAR